MKIRVLGSAAGGGFPQWNCNCRNCSGVRAQSVRARARTQSSIAVSGRDAGHWALVNASPDILAQLRANPELGATRALRDSAIEAIVLVDAQIDHTAGLLMLRESRRPLRIYCSANAHEDLTHGNPLLEVLGYYCGVEWQPLVPEGSEFTIDRITDVGWRAISVPGRPAPYSPHRAAPVPGDNVALVLRDRVSHQKLVYAPGLGALEEPLWGEMRSAACVLVDGTFWSDEEMIRLGISKKRARDIGHLPQSGPGGMLEWLGRLPQGVRRILIHVNNTNPILDEDSSERAELGRAGIEVAEDGLEIVL